MVKQHHVHIADVQPVQAGLNGRVRISHFAARIYFGNDKDLFPRNAQFFHAFPDGLTDLRLVAIGGGGVNKTDAALQRRFDSADAFLSVQAVCAQPVEGHDIAAVERNRAGCQIKAPRIAGVTPAFLPGRLRAAPDKGPDRQQTPGDQTSPFHHSAPQRYAFSKMPAQSASFSSQGLARNRPPIVSRALTASVMHSSRPMP